MTKARFIYDISAKDADLYYATKFLAEDAFPFFVHRGKKYMVMSDLEIDRAKKQALVDEVLSLSLYADRARQKNKDYNLSHVLNEIFIELGIKELEVPEKTPCLIVDLLRQLGYCIKPVRSPFFPERYVKTAEEKKAILNSQKVVFTSMRFARDILKQCKIKSKNLIYKGKALSSERLRTMIEVFLMEREFLAEQTIVSCGLSAIDPHDIGHGLLKAGSSIIVDIFPKSLKSRYYGDATRTFCRGRAPDSLKRMYEVVKAGQKLALSMVRDGVMGKRIHETVTNFFDKEGYTTGEREGRRVGFFHGTGHSIGLEIHEEPLRVNWGDSRLASGNIVSVEPGLYYPEIGGVRIEDLVYIKDDGCEILGAFPKELEIL